MTKELNIILTVLLGLLLNGCDKKATHVDVDAFVYIIKAVDSLPCQAEIEYADFTNGKKTEQISSNWTVHHRIHYDQYVTLKATGTNNIKTITVEISAKGSTETKNCTGNCTIDVRKDLYN